MRADHSIATWSAQDTTIGEVHDALHLVRRGEQRAAVTTAICTLIIAADDPAVINACSATAVELAQHHPLRIIVVGRGQAEASPRIDAAIDLYAVPCGNTHVSFHRVQLFLQGPVVDHLDSVVTPLAVSELPRVLWSPGSLPAPRDPLLTLADRLIVDSSAFGGNLCFEDLAEVGRRVPTTDLAWHRLLPWREVFADLFDRRGAERFLRDVHEVWVGGATGPRGLLAGWLASRLGLPCRAVHLKDEEQLSIQLVARSDGRTGHFSIATTPGHGEGHCIHAVVQLEGGHSLAHTTVVPGRPAEGLAAAVGGSTGNSCYDDAVSAAVELVGAPC